MMLCKNKRKNVNKINKLEMHKYLQANMNKNIFKKEWKINRVRMIIQKYLKQIECN